MESKTILPLARFASGLFTSKSTIRRLEQPADVALEDAPMDNLETAQSGENHRVDFIAPYIRGPSESR